MRRVAVRNLPRHPVRRLLDGRSRRQTARRDDGTYDAPGSSVSRALLARQREAQVIVGSLRGDAATAGALDEATLQEVWLVDVFHRVACLAESYGDRTDSDGATLELLPPL